MLSAPEPPDGGSPTPPPPALPLRFTDVIGSMPSVARTAPDEFLTSIPPDTISGRPAGTSTATLPNGHPQAGHLLHNGLGPGVPEASQHLSPDRHKKHTRHSKMLSRTSSSGSKDSRDPLETVDGVTGERLNPSDPIPIRTGKH